MGYGKSVLSLLNSLNNEKKIMIKSSSPQFFTKLNQRLVFGIFKQLGSTDPDVIYVKKEELISIPAFLKSLANMMIFFFLLLFLVILFSVIFLRFQILPALFVAIICSPFLLLSIWFRNFCENKMKVVEGGYKKYCQSIGIDPT